MDRRRRLDALLDAIRTERRESDRRRRQARRAASISLKIRARPAGSCRWCPNETSETLCLDFCCSQAHPRLRAWLRRRCARTSTARTSSPIRRHQGCRHDHRLAAGGRCVRGRRQSGGRDAHRHDARQGHGRGRQVRDRPAARKRWRDDLVQRRHADPRPARQVPAQGCADILHLIVEQLRTPAFPAEEFEKAKKQLTGALKRSLEDTDYRADDAFARAVFPSAIRIIVSRPKTCSPRLTVHARRM